MLQELKDDKVRDPAGYLTLAYFSLQLGDPGTYLACASEALKVDPNNIPALKINVSSHLFFNDYKGALPIINRILKLDKKDADTYGQRAYCHAHMDMSKKATADYSKATKLGSQSRITFDAGGLLEFGERDYAEAAELFARVLEPIDKAQKDKMMIALTDLEQSIVVHEARLSFGVALFSQGKFVEASKHFTKCLGQSSEEGSQNLLLWLYMCNLKAGDAATARTTVAETMKRQEKVLRTGSTVNFLGMLLVETDDDKVAAFLRERRKRNAPCDGDTAYLAGKWAQWTGHEELSESYFGLAAQQKRAHFLTASLAEWEIAEEEGVLKASARKGATEKRRSTGRRQICGRDRSGGSGR